MPQFDFPFPRRYNTLRLLGYDYNSTWQLCAISLVADSRLPLFADVKICEERSKVSPQLPDSGTHAFARLHFDA